MRVLRLSKMSVLQEECFFGQSRTLLNSFALRQRQVYTYHMAPESLKILIVDDDVVSAMIMKEHLSKLGFTLCKSVTTGETAIRTAEEEKPDVVFMDITLAGTMDGIEAGETIYSRFKIPVIFLTGYPLDEIRGTAPAVGNSLYLIKPVLVEEMVEAITRLFGKK